MAKYHVKADGAVGACSAKEGKCPFTAADAEHFDNKKNALLFSTAVIAKLEGGSFAQAGFSKELGSDILHNNPSVLTDRVSPTLIKPTLKFKSGLEVPISDLEKAMTDYPEVTVELLDALSVNYNYPLWAWEYKDPDYVEEKPDDEVSESDGFKELELYKLKVAENYVWAVTHALSITDGRVTDAAQYDLELLQTAQYFSEEAFAQEYWQDQAQKLRMNIQRSSRLGIDEI
jgi:hypothetical protein